MICPRCGKQVFDNATSCPYCRVRFQVVHTSQVPPKQEVVTNSPPLNKTETPVEKKASSNENIAFVVILVGIVLIGAIILYETWLFSN